MGMTKHIKPSASVTEQCTHSVYIHTCNQHSHIYVYVCMRQRKTVRCGVCWCDSHFHGGLANLARSGCPQRTLSSTAGNWVRRPNCAACACALYSQSVSQSVSQPASRFVSGWQAIVYFLSLCNTNSSFVYLLIMVVVW